MPSQKPRRSTASRPNVLEAILIHPIISTIHRLASWWVRVLVESSARSFSVFAMRLMLMPFRKTRERNMRRVFHAGGFTDEQFRQLDDKAVRFRGRVFYETNRLLEGPPDDIKTFVHLRGEENLTKALDEGRGALLIGDHLGNIGLPPAILACNGYDVTIVSYPLPTKSLHDHRAEFCRHFGIRIAYIGQGSLWAVKKAFARNQVVILFFEAAARPKANAWLRFGDAAIRADPGAARFARLFNAPTLPVKCRPENDTATSVTIHPGPINDSGSSNDIETMETWLDSLHRDLCNRPEQWFLWGLSHVESASVLRRGSHARIGARV